MTGKSPNSFGERKQRDLVYHLIDAELINSREVPWEIMVSHREEWLL